jgi:hypothetical protein
LVRTGKVRTETRTGESMLSVDLDKARRLGKIHSMSEIDFDVDGLADFLHLLPQKVARLADRGKLPGRKVGGAWRFSRAEIHPWHQKRIGALDDDELAQIEGVLERHGDASDPHPPLGELIRLESIAVPLAAKTRKSVIQSMVDLAAGTGLLWDPVKMSEAVFAREQTGMFERDRARCRQLGPDDIPHRLRDLPMNIFARVIAGQL